MLCGKPSECPTSCATTYARASPTTSSGSGSFCARGSLGEACTKYQSRISLITLWNIRMSASRISPVRGSLTCGPIAFSMVEGSQRMVE